MPNDPGSPAAGVALLLAGRYPETPAAIALEDPPPWWADDVEPPFSER